MDARRLHPIDDIDLRARRQCRIATPHRLRSSETCAVHPERILHFPGRASVDLHVVVAIDLFDGARRSESLRQHRDQPAAPPPPSSARQSRSSTPRTNLRLRRHRLIFLWAAGLEDVERIDSDIHPLVYADGPHAGLGKPTVLIDGHFVVQPVDLRKKWDAPPFEPTVRGDNGDARGASDDKAQTLVHVEAVEALLKTAAGCRSTSSFSSQGKRSDDKAQSPRCAGAAGLNFRQFQGEGDDPSTAAELTASVQADGIRPSVLVESVANTDAVIGMNSAPSYRPFARRGHFGVTLGVAVRQ